jgi:IMP dehydrogenase/GMP reductase
MTSANALEYADARKYARTRGRRMKQEYEGKLAEELQDRYSRHEERKVYEGCVTLREAFNQELRYVGSRLGT